MVGYVLYTCTDVQYMSPGASSPGRAQEVQLPRVSRDALGSGIATPILSPPSILPVLPRRMGVIILTTPVVRLTTLWGPNWGDTEIRTSPPRAAGVPILHSH